MNFSIGSYLSLWAESPLNHSFDQFSRAGFHIYDTGGHARYLFQELERAGFASRLLGWIDHSGNLQESVIFGKPVLGWDDLDTLPLDAPIIVAHGREFQESRHRLALEGFRNTAGVLDINAWMRGFHLRERIETGAVLIERLHAALADEESQAVLEGVLAYRLSGDISELASRCSQPAYFVPGLFTSRQDAVFVDAGAYDGDTIRAFIEASHGDFTHIHGIEPGADNYTKLVRTVDDLKMKDRVTLHACGLGDTAGAEGYDPGGGADGRFSASGKDHVEVKRLDDLLLGTQVTMLKMDIEGAEPEALAGACRMISECRPMLAISVYHEPDHLWTLPLRVMDTWPGYRIFLRHHSTLLYETICYALPTNEGNRSQEWKGGLP